MKRMLPTFVSIAWYKGSYTVMAKGNENSSIALTNDPVF